jgi:hypothetical protein
MLKHLLRKEHRMSRALSVAVLFIAACAVSAGAAVVERTAHDQMVIDLTFESRQFSFERVDGFDLIRADGMACLAEEGAPALPRCPVHVAVPYNTRVTDVHIESIREVELAGRFNILPTQPPTVLGAVPARWVDGDPAIYADNAHYPMQLLGGVTQGFMGNSRILSFYVAPLRYNPITGSMMLVEEMEVVVELKDSRPERPVRRDAGETDPVTRMVRGMVSNPRDVSSFATDLAPAAPTALPPAYFEYVIVTQDSLVASFAPLVEWKTQKGVPATCVTLQYIQANYTGANDAEMIKAFIVDAYQNWGTSYILMGGDTELITSRWAYAMDCEMGVTGNRIRADLFFSDLDNLWNDNEIAPYGEVADNVDMYPDVFVGRAPANSIADAATFVDKVLLYEKNPPADYALKMMMAGEVLWADPFTDASIGLDAIDEECVPPRFDPILKLYQTSGNESPETVIAGMNDGQNFIIHDGHCFWYVMGAGDGSIFTQDADSLINYPRNFIITSIGCWPAAIETDCIAEHMLNNPFGGCVAFIGNSRYGWGSPGNPGFGYSDYFQHELVRRIFVEEDVHIGFAHGLAKARYVPFAGGENVFRYCEYQYNLLGDPEMRLWTDEPREFDIDLPADVMGTSGGLRVVASDSWGACEGAVVCVTNGGDVYLTGTTDISGSVEFTVNTASPESLLVTVSGYNHLPVQTRVNVVNQGVHLAWTGCQVSDGADGKANPGETATLAVTVKNYGTEDGAGVSGLLHSGDALCTVTDSTAYYGTVEAGGEATGDGFEVSLDSTFENGDVVMLELTLTDTLLNVWTVDLPIVIAAPVLEVTSYGIDELVGDGDFIIEPGEQILVTLQVSNTGLTYASATASASASDPYLSVEDSVAASGTIDAGSSGFTLHKLSVSGGAPEPYVGIVTVDLEASDGSSFTDTIYINVGDLWFAEDCEAGEADWTRAGEPDLWHLSSYRAHSGSYSWHYGIDSTHVYPRNANSNITSLSLMAGEENRLSFWYWYDLTTYGSDGVYVVIHAGGIADTVEFIGSGGALNNPPQEPLNISSDWVEWSTDLVELVPGDSVRIEFAFYSDGSDEAEGVYIDDIALRSRTPEKTGVGDVAGGASRDVLAILPNPVYEEVRIMMAPHAAALSLSIYDVEGRLVTELRKPAGAHSVSWNLKDSGGRRVAPGIYLAKVKGDAYSTSRKIVVLR